MSTTPAGALPSQDLDSTLREDRVLPPPPEFAEKAYIHSLAEYEALYRESIDNPEGFWASVAEHLHWFKTWDKVLEWNLPHAKWFVGGKTNLSYNCLDVHLSGPRRDKVALIWEGERGEVRRLTYAELHAEVQRFANALKALGIKKGDPGYYRLKTEWAMRLTWSGEFLHSAPWSVGSQGSANVSHGCTDLSPSNAKWLFDHSKMGDVVKFVGSQRKLEEYNGYTMWNQTASQWAQKSALAG